MTLVQKDEDTIIAEMKAVIWANQFKTLSAGFKDATGIELSKGIKILFEAAVSFHERYGLKLIILNIDPSYTIGELTLKRKEILERLSKEGLKDRNKLLEFPLVPQRIGVISSPAAAGYEDFMNHLTDNPYGYAFNCRLYEAFMQGDRAEESIITALDRCLSDSSHLDVVVIVRGGGGKPDLHCFDSYGIGRAIAFLPLPVISGIGHERDTTVVDEVSSIRVKTPTAAADIILTRVKEFEDGINLFAHRLFRSTNRLTLTLRESFSALTKRLEDSVRSELLGNYHKLDIFIKGLRYSSRLIQNKRRMLQSREENIVHLDPRNVLKRGYSITYDNDKVVKSVSGIQAGNRIRTVLYQGELMSIVEGISRKSDA